MHKLAQYIYSSLLCFILSYEKNIKQRFVALFLLWGILAGTFVPTMSVLAAQNIKTSDQVNSSNPHINNTLPTDANKPMKQNYPAGQQPQLSKIPAASDTKNTTNGLTSSVAAGNTSYRGPLAQKILSNTKSAKNKASSEEALNTPKDQPKSKITPHELTNRRTATSTESVNADGSITKKNYFTPKFFKKDNKWVDIDTSLVEDKNAGDSGNIFGKALGKVESWLSSPTDFMVKDNDWQARFSPSGSGDGMLRIKMGNSQIGFSPINAKDIAPVITIDKDGTQTVHYYDLWPGVNVEYTVESAAVKENIVLKDKDAANSVSFKLLGADLEKQPGSKKDKTATFYKVKGALNNEFAVAPSNLILNNFGPVTQKDKFAQTYENGNITLSVDKDYLQNLPDKAFPAVIDPGVFRSTFGTRAGGNYVSFKSDGYICYSNVCNPYAGSLYDSNNVLRYWRGAFFAPYDQFRNSSTLLTSANLHLTQRTNAGFWTGTYNTHTFYVDHATCLNSFSCHELGANHWWVSGNVSTTGNIDVTDIYDTMISRGDFGAWLMISSEDGTTSSFKNFDPNNSYIDFTYGGPPAPPTVGTPTDQQVYVDTQPSFKVNYENNPNGSTPLKYMIQVSSGVGGYGTLVTSGLLNSTSWTIPDGILQDGITYYVRARSYDPITPSYSGWGPSISFRIDERKGSANKTQTYDTLGPVNVDLATGNLSTGSSSHTSKALGGDLGVSLNYNSPLKSREGLVGEYYNYMDSTTAPVLTRVDQNLDFTWNGASPGAPVHTSEYLVEWNGYFIAPETGTYTFGALKSSFESMDATINGTFSNMNCSSGICYDTNGAVTLSAGQVVPINVELLLSSTDPSSQVHLYVKGAVSEQVVPKEWLQTGVRPSTDQQGLTGNYFGKFDGTNTFSSGNPLLMKRTDHLLSFDWGTTSPMPKGPSGYLVRWTGYITVPVSGNYQFGSLADDGTKIMLGNSNTVVYNDWTTHSATEGYGSNYSMTANTPTKITVEYFNNGGPGSFQLKVQGAVTQQIVPSSWLSPDSKILPDGWNLGIDPNGGANYDHIVVNQDSVVLSDSTGATHEYKWDSTKQSYTPPVNEDGHLARNADGTYTLQDTDGRTYVFDKDGTLTSLTSAADDTKPAALQYEYQSEVDGPPHLYKIKDAVDPSRNATLYYSGDSHCASSPSGFDSAPPAGMLCAVITNDDRATNFFYTDGQLARINRPGNDDTDYLYQAIAHSTDIAGYLLTGIRDSLANDAIAAGVQSNDETATTQVGYDYMGRVTSITQPAATPSATRIQHTIDYLPGAESYEDENGNLVPGYAGMAEEHITGANEPNGFMRRVKYDALFRTTEDTDNTNLSTTNEWDQKKDLLYSSTTPTGLKTTTIYDDEERAVTSYGPAPKGWFDASDPKNQTPLSTYASQVPRTDSAYDENIVGPSVAWYDYTKQTGNANGVLSGAPKLHTTGIDTSAPGTLSYNFSSPPITASTGAQGIGFSAIGKVRLPAGTYTFSATTPDGVRLWVNDQLVVDQWTDSSTSRTTTSSSFVVSSTSPERFKLDVYRKTGATGSFSLTVQQQGGFGATADWSSYLKPDYSLPTSAKTYDATLGDKTAAVNYGSNPELGLAQSASIDPSGLNLTTTTTHETQGASGSFLRQTAKYSPGANTSDTSTGTQYSYYGATETRDNPCTEVTESYKQAGMLKTVTDPDPDGTASQTARTAENIYDDAGRIVASRVNDDDWTCNTYDSRGRILTTVVPAYNGEAARTITYSYALTGNPFYDAFWDSNGSITTVKDLLGRTVQYADAGGSTTSYSYNEIGQLSSKTSAKGTETYNYDNYYRLSTYQFAGTTYATVNYDAYNRVDHIDYNNAGDLSLAPDRDSLERANKLTYTLGDGTTTISDTLGLSQSGRVHTDDVQSASSSLSSTFGYDGAGRLTSAGIGSHTFSYGFGAQDASCGSDNDMNANSGKNSNRTSQTIDSVTTTYCYDYADRLISSSDAAADGAEYDSHGNMTLLGTNSTPLHMYYDSSDRNWGLVQYDDTGNGDAMYYDRDATGRITYREHDDISAWSWNMDQQYWYEYTDTSDSPDIIRDANWDIVQETLQLPGGVMLTINPQQSGSNQKQYSLPSALGHTLLTVDADGTNTSNGNGPLNSFTYDPFGNILPGGNNPDNTLNGSYGFGGSRERLTETSLASAPVQMGTRVYLPSLGRFTQVDPVPGGNANDYVYVLDPINASDYSGLCGLQGSCGCSVQCVSTYQVQATTTYRIQAAASIVTIYRATSVIVRAAAKPAAKPRNNSTRLPVAKVVAPPQIKLPAPNTSRVMPGADPRDGGFDYYHAAGSAAEWYAGGRLTGGVASCVIWGLLTIEAGGVGCIGAAATGSTVGGGIGGTIGWILGGNNAQGSDLFEWGPDQVIVPW